MQKSHIIILSLSLFFNKKKIIAISNIRDIYDFGILTSIR